MNNVYLYICIFAFVGDKVVQIFLKSTFFPVLFLRKKSRFAANSTIRFEFFTREIFFASVEKKVDRKNVVQVFA